MFVQKKINLIKSVLRENPCIINNENATLGNAAKVNVEPPFNTGLETAVAVAVADNVMCSPVMMSPFFKNPYIVINRAADQM